MTAWLGISELTVRVPSAPPRMMMMIPWKSRNPASVTMNEGILRRAARVPWIAPMNPQQSSETRIASHHGQAGPGSCCTSLNAIVPPSSATDPMERSISPRSSTEISAVARTMYTVLRAKMYTRLLGRRYAFSGVMISKTTATMMMPKRTGRTPLSPLRMRCSQARRYWPRD